MKIDDLLFRSKEQSSLGLGATTGRERAVKEDGENVAHAQNMPTAPPQLRIALPERPSVLHEVSTLEFHQPLCCFPTTLPFYNNPSLYNFMLPFVSASIENFPGTVQYSAPQNVDIF